MERGEPIRGEGADAPGGQDWGNLRFRRRSAAPARGTPDDNADARFFIWIVVFLFVAAVYPWYSHFVNARLLAWELEAASKQLERQVEASSKRIRQQVAADTARRQEEARRQRIASVQVVGALPSQRGPIAIVRLGQSNLDEAGPAICRQAEAMLRTPLQGQVLRVQQHRGSAPALEIGAVDC